MIPMERLNTVNQVQMLNYLNDDHFKYWLTFFAKVMPHCEILFRELQSRSLDHVKINTYIS